MKSEDTLVAVSKMDPKDRELVVSVTLLIEVDTCVAVCVLGETVDIATVVVEYKAVEKISRVDCKVEVEGRLSLVEAVLVIELVIAPRVTVRGGRVDVSAKPVVYRGEAV